MALNIITTIVYDFVNVVYYNVNAKLDRTVDNLL